MFLCSLLPVISLRLSLYTTLGERFLYLPSAFFCIVISYLSAVIMRRPKSWLAVIAVISTLYGVALYRTNQIWRQAGWLCRAVQIELAETAPKGPVVILNAPDNLLGVPVFHNGLAEAVRDLPTPARIDSVDIVAFQTLLTSVDTITTTDESQRITLALTNPQGELTRAASAGCAALLAHNRISISVSTAGCAAADLFVFDNGRMRRLVRP